MLFLSLFSWSGRSGQFHSLGWHCPAGEGPRNLEPLAIGAFPFPIRCRAPPGALFRAIYPSRTALVTRARSLLSLCSHCGKVPPSAHSRGLGPPACRPASVQAFPRQPRDWRSQAAEDPRHSGRRPLCSAQAGCVGGGAGGRGSACSVPPVTPREPAVCLEPSATGASSSPVNVRFAP